MFRFTRDPSRSASLVRTGDTRTAFTASVRPREIVPTCNATVTAGGSRAVSVTEPAPVAPPSAHEGILRRQSLRESAARTYARSLPIVPAARPRAHHRGRGRPPVSGLPVGRGHPGARPQPPGRARSHPEGHRLRRPLHVLDLATPVKDAFTTELFATLPRQFADNARIQFCGPCRNRRRRGRVQAGPRRDRALRTADLHRRLPRHDRRSPGSLRRRHRRTGHPAPSRRTTAARSGPAANTAPRSPPAGPNTCWTTARAGCRPPPG